MNEYILILSSGKLINLELFSVLVAIFSQVIRVYIYIGGSSPSEMPIKSLILLQTSRRFRGMMMTMKVHYSKAFAY